MANDPRTPEAIARARARSRKPFLIDGKVKRTEPKSAYLRRLEKKQTKAPRIHVVELRRKA